MKVKLKELSKVGRLLYSLNQNEYIIKNTGGKAIFAAMNEAHTAAIRVVLEDAEDGAEEFAVKVLNPSLIEAELIVNGSSAEIDRVDGSIRKKLKLVVSAAENDFLSIFDIEPKKSVKLVVNLQELIKSLDDIADIKADMVNLVVEGDKMSVSATSQTEESIMIELPIENPSGENIRTSYQLSSLRAPLKVLQHDVGSLDVTYEYRRGEHPLMRLVAEPWQKTRVDILLAPFINS